ncbi:MAG TPA: methylcrotonoyl-CoA carboxylase, partial [Balneola sp.]|nr:methylcrotonoyl-CoA carboxylase [Balneola sp.]
MANSNASKQDNWLNELLNNLRKQEHEIMLGGGQKRIDKEHAKGKLTARERIELLIDNESEFYELGLWAGYEMYEEVGGCPGGGVVTGIG